MDAIQAAILIERIKYLKSVIKKRRSIAKLYFKKLKTLPVDLPLEEKFEHNTYHLFVIRTKKREKINKLLKIKRNRYWCTLSDSNTQAAGIQKFI